MEKKKFNIETKQSRIAWTGRKVTGAHNGTIDIASGVLETENNKLTGGHFIIDTNSIKILDIKDEATNTQFAGHLASADFFSADKFPAASFSITNAVQRTSTQYHIEGKLTIKAITHPIAFDAQLNISGGTITASGKIVVDRTKYDMKFRSGNFFKDLGDTLIYNDFELDINITAKTALQVLA